MEEISVADKAYVAGRLYVVQGYQMLVRINNLVIGQGPITPAIKLQVTRDAQTGNGG